jgi:hypothetical protein
VRRLQGYESKLTREGSEDAAEVFGARLLNIARQEGRVFYVLLVRFALERLLYRLSISGHRDRFVLKGGMLVTVWVEDDNRVTRDADFLGHGDPDPEAVLACSRGDFQGWPKRLRQIRTRLGRAQWAYDSAAASYGSSSEFDRRSSAHVTTANVKARPSNRSRRSSES